MTFAHSESGAVTVDWVVLTAGLVGLGLATMSVVSSGVEDVAEDTSGLLSRDNNQTLIRTAFGPIAQFSLGGEDLTGVLTYGEAGATLTVSDALGSVSGDTAFVVTSSLNDNDGRHAGGVMIPTPANALEIGATYRMSYWARAETGTVNTFAFQTGGGATNASLGVQATPVGTEWTYVEHEFVMDHARTTTFVSTTDLGVTFAVDDIQLAKID